MFKSRWVGGVVEKSTCTVDVCSKKSFVSRTLKRSIASIQNTACGCTSSRHGNRGMELEGKEVDRGRLMNKESDKNLE